LSTDRTIYLTDWFGFLLLQQCQNYTVKPSRKSSRLHCNLCKISESSLHIHVHNTHL